MAFTRHRHSSSGTAPGDDASVESFFVDEHGALNLSWTLPVHQSTGIISLEPSSNIWSRLHPSCIATSTKTTASRACDSPPLSPPPPPKPPVRTRSGSNSSVFPHFRFLDLSKDIRLIIYDFFTYPVSCFLFGCERQPSETSH